MIPAVMIIQLYLAIIRSKVIRYEGDFSYRNRNLAIMNSSFDWFDIDSDEELMCGQEDKIKAA